jgi:hypothetical protein
VQCDRHFVDAPTLAKHSVGKGWIYFVFERNYFLLKYYQK